MVERLVPVIRIDALWLATNPIDMHMGTERLLAQVVLVFGSAQAHHGCLFANARGNRIKLLLHDGFARGVRPADSIKADSNGRALALIGLPQSL